MLLLTFKKFGYGIVRLGNQDESVHLIRKLLSLASNCVYASCVSIDSQFVMRLFFI